jgi:hypothetical protein
MIRFYYHIHQDEKSERRGRNQRMMEFIKVIIVVGGVLGIVLGIERLFLMVATRLNIDRKVLRNAGIVLLFLAASISGLLLVLTNRSQE